jgi:hypothetical protein
LLGDLRRRVFIELKVVLEIPADALAVLRCEFELNIRAEIERLDARNIRHSDVYSISVWSAAGLLIDTQDRHALLPFSQTTPSRRVDHKKNGRGIQCQGLYNPRV